MVIIRQHVLVVLNAAKHVSPLLRAREVLEHDVEVVGKLSDMRVGTIRQDAGVPSPLDDLLEHLSGLFVLTEVFELLQVEVASLLMVDHVKELLDVFVGYLNAIVHKHLVQLTAI